jgi:hypothetical protein
MDGAYPGCRFGNVAQPGWRVSQAEAHDKKGVMAGSHAPNPRADVTAFGAVDLPEIPLT